MSKFQIIRATLYAPMLDHRWTDRQAYMPSTRYYHITKHRTDGIFFSLVTFKYCVLRYSLLASWSTKPPRTCHVNHDSHANVVKWLPPLGDFASLSQFERQERHALWVTVMQDISTAVLHHVWIFFVLKSDVKDFRES
jgi:hypothetical protein